MYIDTDSKNRISILELTPEEALRLSIIIRCADPCYKTGPLLNAADQLYLHANRALDSILEIENEAHKIKE